MVNIKVAVRIRPMSAREQCQHDSDIVSNSDKSILVTNPKISEKHDGADSRQRVRRFAVDFCYDPKYPELATQQAVFEEVGTEVVGHMLAGYNACVLAYGHSASGKTYTMMGDAEDPGLTPRICRELAARMRQATSAPYHVSISFLEIYNEKVRDLLVEEQPSAARGFSLRVREHPKLGPYVQDLSEHVVETEEDLLGLLNLGNSRRSTAATESNIHSSRSHAVFTIRFKQVGETTAKYSKVHLVDLAGSLQEEETIVKTVRERASAIQSRARMKEGANINKSLVTLGNVISALADSCETAWGKSFQPFVPYRDSVLTWLLKDTLGGNSNTIMIATVSPASSCYMDTINTLRYAKRTKKIVNQPLINEDPKIRTIRELKDEVSRLKTMLASFASNADKGEEMTASTPSSSKSLHEDAAVHFSVEVALQTDPMHLTLNPSRSFPAGTTMELTHDLLGHLALISSSSGTENVSCETEDWLRTINNGSATPDILPSATAPLNKQSSCNAAVAHVSEINAGCGNESGVNRVIADRVRPFEACRQKPVSSGTVPRVSRSPFKPRRALRRTSAFWDMLHRSRPDLIKGIGARSGDPSTTSSQPFADPLSQSTSDNSLHSSGSAEARVGPKQTASLSRTSSIGEASGSSTPTQPTNRPVVRRRENKRAEIVASVTSRLYATKKKPDPRQEAILAAEKEKDDEDDDELDELKLCKRARMKLFDMSRKLALTKKAKKTADSEVQTETNNSTLRMKEKSIATEQQGVLQVASAWTNTSSEPPDPPLVMNHLFLPNGDVLLQCGTQGSSIHLQVPPPSKHDISSQTPIPTRDQSTSPEKMFRDSRQSEEYYSDDSLESESSDGFHMFNVRRNKTSRHISNKSRSCQDLSRIYVPSNHHYCAPFFQSHPNIHIAHNCVTHDFPVQNPLIIDKLIPATETGTRVERSLSPIARYNISGTNAFYEYDPNKSVSDKVIFSNTREPTKYEPGETPPLVYPKYDNQLFNGLSAESSEGIVSANSDEINTKSVQSIPDENLSSETSSASLGSSIGSCETSSDDFVFVDNVIVLPPPNRDLYPISEISEPSCSNRSSPTISSPRVKNAEDAVIKPAQLSEKSEKPPKYADEEPRQINWAEMECKRNNKFINFNYTPSQIGDSKGKTSNDGLFPSEDSITFIFLEAKQPETSVLMEIVKRSLLGGSEPSSLEQNKDSRSRGVQCSTKLMRSVSVDTAMIALSRIARHQRRGMSRATSLSNVASEPKLIDAENQSLLMHSDNSVQCCLVDTVDASSDVHPTDQGSQCDIEASPKYSLGTSTTHDQETETDVEKAESATQTELEKLFDDPEPQLPRRAISPMQEYSGTNSEDNERLLKKEMRNIILGRGKDLFPNYLASDESDSIKNTNKGRTRKTVSWSDLTGVENSAETPNEDFDSTSSPQDSSKRNAPCTEPSEDTLERPHTLPRRIRPTANAVTKFIKEATSLLKNLKTEESSESPDSDECEEDQEHALYSSSSLLRRRRRQLTRLKVNKIQPSFNECSVQTDVEKIDRIVQTGSLASSLVGPPIRRCVTPNTSRVSRDELSTANSTWPRRRISAKPPLSPRTVRRFSGSSTNGSINSSNVTSPRRSHSSLSHRQSPRKSPCTSVIEQSCYRLQNAIELDKMRERHLDDCLDLYFSDESSKDELSLSTWHEARLQNYPKESVTNCFGESRSNTIRDRTSTYQMQFSKHIPQRDYITHSTSNSIPTSPITEERLRTSARRYRNNAMSDLSDGSDTEITMPLSSTTQQNVRKCQQKLLTDNDSGRRSAQTTKSTMSSYELYPLSSRASVKSASLCGCTCHSCVLLSNGNSRQCHTCCIPCSSESNRPYSSEPSLSLPSYEMYHSNARISPLAHLRKLISLRKTIVEAEKTVSFTKHKQF